MKKLLFVIPLLATSLAGCSSGSNEITLKIWEDESNVEMVQTLADEFLENYRKNYPNSPKITIEFTKQAEKSAIEEMTRGISESGNGPDIAAVTHDTIVSGVYNKVLAPVSFDQSLQYRMTSDAMNAVTVDDVVYGYPITAESTTIMYDSTKVSATELADFDALLASGKKLSWDVTTDGGYYTFGLCTDSVLFGEDGKDPKSVDIATEHSSQNILDFFTKYRSVILDEPAEKAVASIEAGRTVGLISSPFILNSMKASLKSNLKLATLPKINGEDLRPFSGYKAYVVSKYSEHGALAQELCNFLTSYDANLYRLKTNGYLPAVPLDATEKIAEAVADDEFASVFAASLDNSMVMPSISEMTQFWKKMNNATTALYNANGDLTLQKVKDTLQEVTDNIKGA